MCSAKGRLTPATVVDHVKPHRGDYNAFVLGDLQSLCTDCHDRFKQYRDIHGFSRAVDENGWPLDPNHPTYASNSIKAGFRRKRIP
jgi:5-methylcytosine-specific restriction endonuclease McrA